MVWVIQCRDIAQGSQGHRQRGQSLLAVDNTELPEVVQGVQRLFHRDDAANEVFRNARTISDG